MDIAKRIGANLLRLRGKLTQEQFAAATGIDQSSLSQWENGKRLRYLQELADRLEVAGFDPMELLISPGGLPSDEATEFDDPTMDRLLRLARTLSSRGRIAVADMIDEIQSGDVDAESAALMARLRVADPGMRQAIISAVELMLRGSGARKPGEP